MNYFLNHVSPGHVFLLHTVLGTAGFCILVRILWLVKQTNMQTRETVAHILKVLEPRRCLIHQVEAEERITLLEEDASNGDAA